MFSQKETVERGILIYFPEQKSVANTLSQMLQIFMELDLLWEQVGKPKCPGSLLGMLYKT